MIPRPERGGGDQALFLRNVKFTYESGVAALKGATLEIDHGEYVAVVGGNGSGKTTLAKLMNGLLRPAMGQVLVSGKDSATMTTAEVARIVGYAFQNPDHQLFCGTIEDEVAFGPRNMGLSTAEVERRADRAIGLMGLSALRDKPPLSLPLGIRRRVSIASVIAMESQVLIFDEPTTGLDASETEDLMAIIRKLNDEGRTIVLITHEMKLVAEHADRVVVMAEGRVVLDSETRGAFSDVELLRRSKLLPPPVTLLAHKLSQIGVSRDVMTPQELVSELTRGDDG